MPHILASPLVRHPCFTHTQALLTPIPHPSVVLTLATGDRLTVGRSCNCSSHSESEVITSLLNGAQSGVTMSLAAPLILDSLYYSREALVVAQVAELFNYTSEVLGGRGVLTPRGDVQLDFELSPMSSLLSKR